MIPDKLDLAELREKADWVIEWFDGDPGMPPPEIEEVVRAVPALIKRVEDAEAREQALKVQETRMAQLNAEIERDLITERDTAWEEVAEQRRLNGQAEKYGIR